MRTLAESDQLKLELLLQKVRENTRDFLGYPVAKDFDYRDLSDLLKYPLNNLGDPFMDSTFTVDSKEMERELLSFIAKLFRAPENDWWGYVNNGSSEGNLYGLYLARELYPNAIVYYSEATHYSVQKNLHLLHLSGIVVRSQRNGEICYDDLEQLLNRNRHVPAIILANIGTTMSEARDKVNKLKQSLKKAVVKNYYIHCDAALSGGIVPFLDPRPSFDFEDGADSISLSGHKFFGSPVPCGVVIVRKANRDRIARSVSYIGSMDTTITGSRNGLAPVFLWHTIKSLGMEGLKKRVEHSLEVAAYTVEQLRQIGIEAWRNEQAITVVLPTPSASIIKKYQLATENGYSHIICMPNVSKKQIDEVVISLAPASEG
ncbi:MAG TPA: histidine decarboxylase [Bacteroidia bacterium]|jgi:histidine decarboxylase|nr:histidine decarboxylase [Bacteroidia bacterium]